MDVYIYSFVIGLLSVMFFATSKPIVLHYILIFCYTIYNPITNKIMFAILLIWLIKLFFQKKWLSLNKYVILIWVVGTYWLISGVIGLNYSVSMTISEDLLPTLVSPYVNGVIWSVIVVITLTGIKDVEKFCMFYATMRFVEIALTGLFFYFWQYDLLFTLQILLGDMHIDVDSGKRLISLASQNANDAAYLLLPTCGFFFYIFYQKTSLLNGLVLLISLIALTLTWTRTGIIMFLILVLLFFLFNIRIRKSFFLFICIMVTVLLPLFFYIYTIRSSIDSRILSDETIAIRFDMYTRYIVNIPQTHFFYGFFEKGWHICDEWNIYPCISPENIFIDTYIKHGILAGILFSLICFVFIIISILNVKITHLASTNIQRKDILFVRVLSAIFLCVFFMINTTLYRQSSFFWLLFGLIVSTNIDLRKIYLNNKVCL